MKILLKKIAYLIISFFHLFYNLKTAKYLDKINISIRSMWLRCEFKHIGDSVFFLKGLYLLGAKHITIGNIFCYGKG